MPEPSGGSSLTKRSQGKEAEELRAVRHARCLRRSEFQGTGSSGCIDKVPIGSSSSSAMTLLGKNGAVSLELFEKRKVALVSVAESLDTDRLQGAW